MRCNRLLADCGRADFALTRESDMVARKSNMTPAPARPELERLIEKARAVGVTEAQLIEQRASFAYGNAPEGSTITKESARHAASTVRLLTA